LNQSGRPIRVGLISTRVFPDRGGPANHVFNLSVNLSSQGVSNLIVACTPQQGVPKVLAQRFCRLPIRVPDQGGLIALTLFSFAYLVLGTASCIGHFLRAKVDIVHAQSPAISGIVGIVVSGVLRKPLMYTVHGLAGPRHPWSKNGGSIVQQIVEASVLRRAKVVLLVSSDYTQPVRSLAPNATMAIVGNGVDVELFHPCANPADRESIRKHLGIPADTVVMVWVGNFDLQEKVLGVIDMILALSIVVNAVPTPCLMLLVGSGAGSASVEKLVTDEGLSDSVRFLGYREDVRNILQAADIFILVSHHEGSPNALLEAMAVGLPCIVTRIGGMPQIVGEAGCLVEPGQIQKIASELVRLASDSPYRIQLSQRARTRALNHLSWYRVAADTIRIYSRAVI